MKNEWLFPEPVQNMSILDMIQREFCITLPRSYIDGIEQFNGAYPECSRFMTKEGNERTVKCFLSVNQGDDDNIWDMNLDAVTCDYVAFAMDDFGNSICFSKKDLSIWFWDHETEQAERVADGFDVFIASLYD